MNLLDAHYVHQTCDILDGLIDMFPETPGKHTPVVTHYLFIFFNERSPRYIQQFNTYKHI